MSKRYIYPQQYGERKKAKLDVTVSDHNFPLSQNPASSKPVEDANAWGDDNDDEILLLVSQACEEAQQVYNNSTLPDYSLCMQPSSTSTQNSDPIPSTSKSNFNFKKPTFSPLSAISTNMRDKFKTISSPLPGLSKVCTTGGIDVSDDIIIKDNILKNQDTNHIYKQLLQLNEDNEKLKLENGKLLEKCFTKEGEASILRNQLKSFQTAVDNARLDKIKAQEKAQMEWSEKLTAVNKQLHDLRNQLDFKNLEMLSVKEKCKMLESNRVKLTQITVAGNDIGSQRYNNSVYIKQEPTEARIVRTASNSVQTDNKSHFLKLNIVTREEPSNLPQILPYIMEPTTNQYSILDYNEKLRQPTDIQNKCRIFSTFHRLPATSIGKELSRSDVNLSCIYEDLTCIAANNDSDLVKYLNIINTARTLIKDLQTELELVGRRMTTAFQKEMDERYIESTTNMLVVETKDLLSGRALFKEEQGILARRMLCVLTYVLEDCTNKELLYKVLENEVGRSNDETDSFVDDISNVCVMLDSTTCAVLYSGFLASVPLLLLSMNVDRNQRILQIITTIINSRPMPFVTKYILQILGKIKCKDLLAEICSKVSSGNLKVDYDQGVLLYKKDSCTLQVLLKQTEVALKCMEQQQVIVEAVTTSRSLLRLYCNLNSLIDCDTDKYKCDCQLVFIQVIVFALRICADFFNNEKLASPHKESLLSVCRGGAQLAARARVDSAHAQGALQAACRRLAAARLGDLYNNILTEITNTFQTAPEELPPSYQTQAWLKSFQAFSIAD